MKSDTTSSNDRSNSGDKMQAAEAPAKKAKLPKVDRAQTTILLLGANSQLGYVLRRFWTADEYVSSHCVVATQRDTLDIADEASVRSRLKQSKPDVVINCAAFTDIRQAEKDRELCWRTNALGAGVLARLCSEEEIHLFHISTASVFGADNSRLAKSRNDSRRRNMGLTDAAQYDPRYREDDIPGPISYYGASKLAAEHAILQAATDNPTFQYWIIRTAGMFEDPWRVGRNAVWTLANRLALREPLRALCDAYTSICYVNQLVDAIAWMVEHRKHWENGSPLCVKGIYHLANTGGPSWYELSQRLATKLNYPPDRVVPVRLDESRQNGQSDPLISQYSVLDTTKYERTIMGHKDFPGPKFSPWQDVLDTWCRLMPVSGQQKLPSLD